VLVVVGSGVPAVMIILSQPNGPRVVGTRVTLEIPEPVSDNVTHVLVAVNVAAAEFTTALAAVYPVPVTPRAPSPNTPSILLAQSIRKVLIGVAKEIVIIG